MSNYHHLGERGEAGEAGDPGDLFLPGADLNTLFLFPARQ